MGLYKILKKTVSDTFNSIVDANATQAQKNRLKVVMRNESRIINEAYIELGKYYYNNLREDSPENLANLCDRVDSARKRLSRAQVRYSEVLREELIQREISLGEAKKNLSDLKEPIADKAKSTADKAVKLTSDTVNRASEQVSALKSKLPKAKVKVVSVELPDEDDSGNGAANGIAVPDVPAENSAHAPTQAEEDDGEDIIADTVSPQSVYTSSEAEDAPSGEGKSKSVPDSIPQVSFPAADEPKSREDSAPRKRTISADTLRKARKLRNTLAQNQSADGEAACEPKNEE